MSLESGHLCRNPIGQDSGDQSDRIPVTWPNLARTGQKIPACRLDPCRLAGFWRFWQFPSSMPAVLAGFWQFWSKSCIFA